MRLQKRFSSGKFFRPWKILFWFALLVLAGLAVRQVPLKDVQAALQHLQLWQIAALAGLNALIFMLWGFRWWLITRAQGQQIPFFALVGYRLAGFGVSYFTPGSQFGGEPLQIHLMHRRHAVPGAAAAASVSIDKLIELMSNFAFLAVGSVAVLSSGIFSNPAPVSPLTPVSLLTPVLALLVAVTAASLPLAYLGALVVGREPLSSASRVLPIPPGSLAGRGLRVAAQIERQAAGICKQKPLVVLTAMLVSLLSWGLMIAEYWLMLSFLGMPAAFTQAIVAMTAARIAFLTPAPAGLGALEVGQVLAVQALGFNPAFGISAALLIRGRDVVMGGMGLLLGAVLSRGPSIQARTPWVKVPAQPEDMIDAKSSFVGLAATGKE